MSSSSSTFKGGRSLKSKTSDCVLAVTPASILSAQGKADHQLKSPRIDFCGFTFEDEKADPRTRVMQFYMLKDKSEHKYKDDPDYRDVNYLQFILESKLYVQITADGSKEILLNMKDEKSYLEKYRHRLRELLGLLEPKVVDEEKSSTAKSEESTSDVKKSKDEKENKKKDVDMDKDEIDIDEIDIDRVTKTKFMSSNDTTVDTFLIKLLSRNGKTDIICAAKKCIVLVARVDSRCYVWYGWNGTSVIPFDNMSTQLTYMNIKGKSEKLHDLLGSEDLVKYGFVIGNIQDLNMLISARKSTVITSIDLSRPLLHIYLQFRFKDNPRMGLSTGGDLYTKYNEWREDRRKEAVGNKQLMDRILQDGYDICDSSMLTKSISTEIPQEIGAFYRVPTSGTRWKIHMRYM